MKKIIILACATATLSLTLSPAIADSIQGKIGVTGTVGFQIPSDGEYGSGDNHTNTGFIFGSGFIYGIDKNLAAELSISHSMFSSNNGDFGVSNVTLGGQYRFELNQPQLVPYVGAGLDVLWIDAESDREVDTTVGVHASAGIDYFFAKQLALTTEAKLVLAPNSDIHGPTGKLGNFDPNSFTTTFGIRYFFK
jgi:outer membrane protein